MSTKRQAIGVFDSGVGGFTALNKLIQLLPHEDLLYLGDTARVPYGNRSVEAIKLYTRQGIEFLLERSVKLILVACNTVSSVALTLAQEISPVPVIGVIKPAVVAALRGLNQGRIGIIGTRTTIQSQSYEAEIAQFATGSGVMVFTQACPLFVPLVEEGWYSHAATYAIAMDYLKPLLEANVEALILGCTHYPLLKNVIQEIMPNVRLIDSGEEAATVTAELLIAQNKTTVANIEHPRRVECCVTDLTSTIVWLAQQFLGLPSEAVQQVSLKNISLVDS